MFMKLNKKTRIRLSYTNTNLDVQSLESSLIKTNNKNFFQILNKDYDLLVTSNHRFSR